MAILRSLRWRLYSLYSRQLMLWGLKRKYIEPYNEELIEELRSIYYGGVPASVLLLSRALTDGYCYDRALLMSRAFLDEDGNVRLVYASVADLRLNPNYNSKNGDHCFVERTTKTGKKFIYDTSNGLVYTKWLYWLIFFPRVRLIHDKSEITDFVESESSVNSETSPYVDRDFVLDLIIPSIEATFGKDGGWYSCPGVELLQREVELFKHKTVEAS